MNQQQLFRQLRDEKHMVQTQVSELSQAFNKLLNHLGARDDDDRKAFLEISNELARNLKVTQPYDNVYGYFSGVGPVARQLRQHTLINDWLQTETRASNQFNEALFRKLELFDFKPTHEQGKVLDTINRFNAMVERVRRGSFSNPIEIVSPPLPTMDQWQTGLYGSPGSGQTLCLVLRVGQPGVGNMETVFMAVPGESPKIWFYHPWEDTWLWSTDFAVTFEGLIDLMEEQFEQALGKANALSQAFDFESELAQLRTQVDAVFDDELRLPAQVVLPSNECVYISYDEERSEVIAPLGGYAVLFINTKGRWPSRIGPKIISGAAGADLQSYGVSDLPVDTQQGLVLKAKQVVAFLARLVNEAKSKDAPLQARATVEDAWKTPQPGDSM